MTAGEVLVYRIGPADEIQFVNDAWDEHALANGGAELVRARILKRSLWDFVLDVPTEHVYRELLRRVRAGNPVSFEFQCDTPSERRRLDMEMIPLTRGGVEFRTRVLATETRPPVEFTYAKEPSSPHPTMCSWCKRVEVQGSWLAIEGAVSRLKLFRFASPPRFTHGICGSCAAGLKIRRPSPGYLAGE